MSIDLAPKLKEVNALRVLIPLLLLHLILISVQVEDPAGTVLFRKWVFLAGAPLYGASSYVSGSMKHSWSEYFWLRGARAENRRLHETVQQLAAREGALAQLKEENQRLRQLLAFREMLPIKTVGGRVIGRAPNYLSNLLYVERGTDDGVQVDAPVLSGSGVLGRTLLVSRHYSQVQLITNADASLGAMVERTRTPGVLKGSGNPLLELNYISNTEPITPGDLVVTSGLDGIYPKGLPVGKIVESYKGKSVFRVILVEPFTDPLRVEEVLIMIGTPKLDRRREGFTTGR